MENFKNLYDLCINNSLTAPTDLATGGHDAENEFKTGKAAFFVNGSWEYAAVSEAVPNATMIPYYCGVEGEEKAGLNCGTENCWAVNAKASEADQKATIDFMVWLVTDPDASAKMVNQLGIMPYKSAKCVVQMTLTTWDEALCRILEPRVCTTRRRVEVLAELQKRGVPAFVWLSPILPFLNDTEENVTAILEACAEVGVRGIVCFGMGMTLRGGNREYYYAALDRHFPGLRARYEKTFGTAYTLSSPNEGRLMALLRERCEKYGMLWRPEDCFRWIGELPERFSQTKLEL